MTHWITSLARIVGSVLPFAPAVIQFGAEIEGREIQERLRRLEDPISTLHPDVRELAGVLYQQLVTVNNSRVELHPELMQRYARPLAMLKAKGLVEGQATIGGGNFYGGIWLTNPTFLMYIAALYEDPVRMETFAHHVESAPTNRWLHGQELAQEYGVPIPFVKAVFTICEQQGLGLMSGTIGRIEYLPRV